MHPVGRFVAADRSDGTAPTTPFFVRDRDHVRGGLRQLVASFAASGNFDGASFALQARLAGVWINVPGFTALSVGAPFKSFGPDAAPIAPLYRFNPSGAGAGTSVSIEIASEAELAFQDELQDSP